MLISFLRLLKVDAYVFYHPVSAKLLIKHTKGTGSIFLYLLRYLITNKNYLLNTAGLCVIAGVMPFISGQFEGVNVMPLGFAVLCLNTPICILLSCDPGLEQAVRTLPGQAKRFCKIENDLWHHPRKYIVPLIMFLAAGLISMWSINIWVLLCIVIAEVLSLSLVVRRI